MNLFCSVTDYDLNISENVFKVFKVRKPSVPDGVCQNIEVLCKIPCDIFRLIFQASIHLCKIPLL